MTRSSHHLHPVLRHGTLHAAEPLLDLTCATLPQTGGSPSLEVDTECGTLLCSQSFE